MQTTDYAAAHLVASILRSATTRRVGEESVLLWIM